MTTSSTRIRGLAVALALAAPLAVAGPASAHGHLPAGHIHSKAPRAVTVAAVSGRGHLAAGHIHGAATAAATAPVRAADGDDHRTAALIGGGVLLTLGGVGIGIAGGSARRRGRMVPAGR